VYVYACTKALRKHIAPRIKAGTRTHIYTYTHTYTHTQHTHTHTLSAYMQRNSKVKNVAFESDKGNNGYCCYTLNTFLLHCCIFTL
jgi:hypothetical protein